MTCLKVDRNIAICMGAKENHENLDYVADLQAEVGPLRDRRKRASTYTASFEKSAYCYFFQTCLTVKPRLNVHCQQKLGPLG
jgi:hypothetical protein